MAKLNLQFIGEILNNDLDSALMFSNRTLFASLTTSAFFAALDWFKTDQLRPALEKDMIEKFTKTFEDLENLPGNYEIFIIYTDPYLENTLVRAMNTAQSQK